jgi:hypothetical protein
MNAYVLLLVLSAILIEILVYFALTVTDDRE